jgi:diacylglycerol kinase (ATP)
MTGNKEKILFFINKKAANKSSAPLVPHIEALIDQNKYVCTFLYWEKQDTKEIIPFIEQADIVAAYGGDGTLNYAGTLCLQYKKILAVLPFGSGNGLARHLKIPLDLAKAMAIINQGNATAIDVVQLNDQYSFNITGVGFDAHVAHQYAKNKRSGFWGYFSEITKGMFSFKPVSLDIQVNNKTIKGSFFMVGVANGSQWGYGYTIFPEAELNDGEMELFMIERLRIWKIPSLVYSFMNKTLNKNKYVIIFKVKTLKLLSETNLIMHIDGEAVVFNQEVNITLLPKQLQVMNEAWQKTKK